MSGNYEIRRFCAKVSSNQDPEYRGRIKVSCPDLIGSENDLPEWIDPVYDWGWFYVPDVDELVEIEMLVGTPRDDVFFQASMLDPEIRWRGKRFWGSESPDAVDRPVPEYFKSNYKRRGFVTPLGHAIIFDDTSGAQAVAIHWTDGTVDDPKYTTILFDSDGTLKLSIENEKHIIHFKQNEIEIKLNEGASLKLTDKDANATTILGDGSVKAAIADHLETFYGTLKTWLEAITVPTGMGPSGTPINAPAPSWNLAINSTKLSFPDG